MDISLYSLRELSNDNPTSRGGGNTLLLVVLTLFMGSVALVTHLEGDIQGKPSPRVYINLALAHEAQGVFPKDIWELLVSFPEVFGIDMTVNNHYVTTVRFYQVMARERLLNKRWLENIPMMNRGKM